MPNWDEQVVEEFRANEGRVGGHFDGIPLILLHHVGRRSGVARISPLSYMRGPGARIYLFAAAGGAPAHPGWYHNLVAVGGATVEFPTETVRMSVTDIVGEERERVFADLLRQRPDIATYEQRTAGVRTIPVLALDPV